MKGLMLKDFLNLKKQWVIIILLLVFYSIFSVASQSPQMVGFAVLLLSIILSSSLFAYDEQSKWDRYALTLPVTRAKIVLSRYLFFLLFIAVLTLFSILLNAGMGIPTGNALLSSAFFASASLLLIAVFFPFLFRFGAERARFLMAALTIIPIIGITLLAQMHLLPEDLSALDSALPFALLTGPVSFVLSLLLSIRIYRRKEF